jgi:hypothetical protein
VPDAEKLHWMRNVQQALKDTVNRIDSQFPRCSRCHKPVDFFERYSNFDLSETIFTIACHGDRETFRITDEVLANANSPVDVLRNAFRGSRILAGPAPTVTKNYTAKSISPPVSPAPQSEPPFNKKTRKITFE